MNFLENVLSLITKLFQVIGNFAKINTCTVYFDEPEVPRELLDSNK
ncbi:cyclic lactone autoinducer peptide [Staphylococcus felis]|nr:cyclic lactone autoinducer peptide [Staphylococcus felis]AVP37566.1 cyclic lactone autoinducer peptide [Staphylococcus felis]MDQ7193985.1 cyclic lactone autoinducer peptide [Staphylococcus felis]PNZ37905.1 cyclic lactone autoinducer peptide [Staphylococcus felis]QQB02484.1 cyclic lactone autoinducer peptide [Staphylococcus felis]REH78927.1 cyclic lactone autoinducer peptide [Staphylococcus felis]